MRPRQLVGSRLSRGYFKGGERPRPELAGKSFMLWRDLQTGIMQFGGADVRARLEPDDSGIEEWVVALIDIGRFSRGSLSKAVSILVEQVANHLGYDGEAYFEVVVDDGHRVEERLGTPDQNQAAPGRDGSDVGEGRSSPSESETYPRPAMLAALPSGEVKRRWRSFLQVLPIEDRSVGGQGSIRIPASCMWNVKLPTELGTPGRYRGMLIDLASRDPLAAFAVDDGQFGASEGYEFAVHRRASDIAVEKLTRAWGTIPSLQRVPGTTEYYYVARQLQFLRSQALVREHIVAELNRLLVRLGASATIELDGAPTARQIRGYMTQLERGEVSFTAALQACRGY